MKTKPVWISQVAHEIAARIPSLQADAAFNNASLLEQILFDAHPKPTELPVNAEGRRGDWFLTYSGRKFYPLDPRSEDVCIQDIAHGLANVCRFGGHAMEFYSVAEHSVHASRIVAPELAKLTLMHDATEAYIGDMVRPLKYSVPQYIEIERKLWPVIAAAFGLPLENPTDNPLVKDADNFMLMTERRDVCTPHAQPWSLAKKYPPLPTLRIEPWSPAVAKLRFLQRFNELS